MNENRELEEAKARLAKGLKHIENWKDKVKENPDPEDLVSGGFDEVELKRIEKHGENEDD